MEVLVTDLSLLDIAAALRASDGVQTMLEAVAETTRRALGYRTIVVNLYRPAWDDFEVVIVLGDEDARTTLLGTSNPWREWQRLLDPDHDRCGAIWLPAGSHDLSPDLTVWMPPIAPSPGPGTWHPEDLLLLPLRGSTGEILGVISVDQPLTGRRPDDSELTVLMAVADHAALALEQAQREHHEPPPQPADHAKRDGSCATTPQARAA
jgi:GAF domain-containing protein